MLSAIFSETSSRGSDRYTEDKMETGVRKPAMAKTLWDMPLAVLVNGNSAVHQKFLQVLSKTMGLERLSELLHMERRGAVNQTAQ